MKAIALRIGVAVVLMPMLYGCAGPDLMPAPTMDSDFCAKTDQARVLLITVKNIGTADAGPTTTTVTFTHTGRSVDIPTPAIPAHSEVALPPVVIQSSDFQPDAPYEITVDSHSVLNEPNRGNNKVGNACVG